MLTALDRLISVFAPQTGVRRAAARAILDQYRDYASAGTGRRNKGWRGRGTSANTEVGGALVTLRNRAREFVRDSWAGQRILDVLTSHVVGTGIIVAPDTGSDRMDNRFRQAWEDWQANSDVEGVLDFGAQQALSLRSMVEGGDSVIRFIDIDIEKGQQSAVNRWAAGDVPFRLLGLEGDQIDVSRDAAVGHEDVRLGVKLGEWGRRQGLYLWRQHPGEQRLPLVGQSSLIAWSELCHLYRPLRFGQVRGITWFAPFLLTGREMQDLTEAAIVKERTQASFAGFIKRPPGGVSPFATKESDGDPRQKITRIEPGMIADIGESEITFAQPSGQSSFAEAYVAGMQAMAAGAGLTYDQLTGDLRQANYSSLRAGKIEFRRLVEQIQWQLLIPRLCLPVVRRFTDRAMLAGVLPSRRTPYRVKFITPANEPIDPKKDLEADILAVRSGRMAPQEFISAWGRDWREVVKDFETFFASTNLTFDIDPRKPANGGRQSTPERNNPDD